MHRVKWHRRLSLQWQVVAKPALVLSGAPVRWSVPSARPDRWAGVPEDTSARMNPVASATGFLLPRPSSTSRCARPAGARPRRVTAPPSGWLGTPASPTLRCPPAGASRSSDPGGQGMFRLVPNSPDPPPRLSEQRRNVRNLARRCVDQRRARVGLIRSTSADGRRRPAGEEASAAVCRVLAALHELPCSPAPPGRRPPAPARQGAPAGSVRRRSRGGPRAPGRA